VQNDGTYNAPSNGNLISRNSFISNGGVAIDLVASGGDNNAGDGVTLNDGNNNSANAGNRGLDFPVISSALNSGTNTLVSGTASSGINSVEVYRAQAGAGDTNGGNGYGEGLQYVGTATVSGGTWYISVTGLSIGDSVSVLGFDASNDTSEFSKNVTVAANSAPVLLGANNLPIILQNPASNPGMLVSSLIAGKITDADPTALTGIAVTAVVNTNGNWQYSTNGGSSWSNFGSPSNTAARLLPADSNTYVRFVPNVNWTGTVTGGVTFRAWDRSDGTPGGTRDASTNGGTSAYSSATASADITVSLPYTISGTVNEDVNGDASLADAVARNGVTVRLYADTNGNNTPDAGDSLVGTTTTASGTYSFTVAIGTYWAVVDSRTIAPNAGFNAGSTQGNVWAEQTYGVAGAFGPSGFLGTAGALFGGKTAAGSDDASALVTSEHVTRVVISNANVTGVDSAFSFNVVTNVSGGDNADADLSNPRSVQGSLRQFIQNANAILGNNAMRFVPAVVTNASSGGDGWWLLNVSTALPQLTDTGTSINGTAYSSVDGVTVRDTNASSIGAGGTVGTGNDYIAGTADDAALPQVPRPELEIHNTGGTSNAIGLDVNGANATIKYVSIWGFGAGISPGLTTEGNIVVRDVSNALIQWNVVGTGAHDFVDPGAGSNPGEGILVDSGDSGNIRNNLVGFNEWSGIHLLKNASAPNGWNIIGN
jgi:hypothetical protein